VTLAGTQTYDGTTNTPAGELTVTNVVAGDSVDSPARYAGIEERRAGSARLGRRRPDWPFVSNANYTVIGAAAP